MRFSSKTFPLVITVVGLAAFGILIPWLGFYQDDWYQIWFGRAYGANIFFDYYAGERPFIAFLYMLTTPLVGTTPIAWQMFGLLARCLAAVIVWWVLRIIWPRHPDQTIWAALLYVIYPGFRVQYASVIYSHYFLQFSIQALSIVAMLLAIRKPRWSWPLTIFSVMGAVFGLFSSEYFFGLELARPVFLWLILAEKTPGWLQRAKQTLAHWMPYLVSLVIFLVWRLFIFKFPTYQPFYLTNPTASPFQLSLQLVKTIGQDTIEMGLLAWAMTVQVLFGVIAPRPAIVGSIALALIFGFAIAFYLMRLEYKKDLAEEKPDRVHHFSKGAIFVGVILLLTSGLPFWFVNLNVNTDINEGSRFGISFMLGSALLLTGLIDLLGQRKTLKISIVAVLVGLSIGFHFLDADFYRDVNRTQTLFFQQLVWRAPGLKPDTLILTNSFEKHVLSGDNSLTAALNWIYEPQPPYSLKYVLFYIPTRLQTGDLTSLDPGVKVSRVFRTAVFTGSTDHALVLYYPYPNCLRVLDPQAHQDLPRPIDMPREIKAAISISNLRQIIADANPPTSLPADLFKYRLDDPSWCFYYEKAELARQQEQWKEIIKLAAKAMVIKKNFQTAWEALPFIEGYAKGGELENARKLTLHVFQQKPEGRAVTSELLCSLWNRLIYEEKQDEQFGSFASQMRDELECR